jgi:digeranylgeranylglycerophospholipid reductase
LGRKYDVVVAGGSVAGLAFAAEAAKRGVSVLVAEEHEEIGEPEKCDGLVSLRGLRQFGFAPRKNVIQNEITAGMFHSPGGKELEVNATALDVVVLDRSEYDKQIAERAESWGAVLKTGTRVRGHAEKDSRVEVQVGDETVEAKYYVDATGPASSPRRGILPAAKYEIEADWLRERTVEVFLDAVKYPGFFAWVIPYAPGRAKVGVAGRGVNSFAALDEFLATRPHRLLRRVPAPIYVGGPGATFVRGRKVMVGESAGQVKPTTAGGIMTSIAGAVIGARWVSDSIQLRDQSLLASYQRDWEARFMKEMRNMLRLRGVFEKLSNNDLDNLLSAIATPKLLSKLSQSDFDFHATALFGALGVGGLLRVARLVASAGARSLLAGS